MKFVFIFSTRLRVYLTELPLLFLFALCYHYNNESTDLFRFYPLMAAATLAIVFILVYFFRGISVSEDEVRMHGLFSSRDRALLKQDSTVTLLLYPKKRVHVLVSRFGDSAPGFSWAKAENFAGKDTVVFREKAFGGEKTAARVLRLFGADEETIDALLHATETSVFETEEVRFSSSEDEEFRRIDIRLLKEAEED